MPLFSPIDLDLSIFLAECCLETYIQYKNNGKLNAPKGYDPVAAFKAVAGGTASWFGFIAESSQNIVIAFRGTMSDADWLSNIEFFQTVYPYVSLGLKTHGGFTAIYGSCREQILKALGALSPEKNLYITGHSLGGALAILCALDIASNTPFKQPTMYNYGSPRVGDPSFALIYDKLIKDSIRIVNKYDTVPALPPKMVNTPSRVHLGYYRHVKDKFTIEAQAGSIYKNHMLETYIDGLLHLR